MFIIRSFAAAPVGQVFASFEITPSGGGGIIVAQARYQNNVLNSIAQAFIVAPFILSEGDKIEFKTLDSGTGGQNEYSLSSLIQEADAP